MPPSGSGCPRLPISSGGWARLQPASSAQSFVLLSKTMGCLSGCLISSASIQKLFCGICSAFKCSFDEFVGEKVVSPSYFSAILGPPSQSGFKIIIFFFWQEYHSIDGLFTASNRWCTIPVCFINGDICFDQPSLLLKYSLPLYS